MELVALLDSGAEQNLLDPTFALELRLPLEKLSAPITVSALGL